MQYESTLRVHLIPRWGKERIRSIKKAQVETWVHEMEANEKLANSTAASHWRVFKMIIRDALLNGMIDASPTHEVDGPYINETTTYVFSPDECWAIVDELPAHYRPIAMLGFGCGMRRGEVFGTCDDVINWDQKLLTVRRQLLQTKETKHQRLIVDRLKTSPRVSSKTVPLPPYLVDALQEHIERFPPQATQTVLWEHRKKLADCKRGSIRALFHTPRGNIVGPRDFTTGMWQPVMRRLGIKDEEGKLPTFHDLRHTFISTCLQNGIPEHTVAAWVGDSVDQLRRTYSHLLRDHADTHGAVAAGLTSRPQTSRFTSAA
ncbi:tyrosine-type recombinase/integrase [Streptomyces sp. bgisy060]|uniref:tyrosine-type recombinase/integrase n=1 Tax=Streptomyces sp. bgisy060 TaxID=3413775 RepID=UPI003EBB5875